MFRTFRKRFRDCSENLYRMSENVSGVERMRNKHLRTSCKSVKNVQQIQMVNEINTGSHI